MRDAAVNHDVIATLGLAEDYVRVVVRDHDLARAQVNCYVLTLVASEVGANWLHRDPMILGVPAQIGVRPTRACTSPSSSSAAAPSSAYYAALGGIFAMADDDRIIGPAGLFEQGGEDRGRALGRCAACAARRWKRRKQLSRKALAGRPDLDPDNLVAAGIVVEQSPLDLLADDVIGVAGGKPGDIGIPVVVCELGAHGRIEDNPYRASGVDFGGSRNGHTLTIRAKAESPMAGWS